MPASQKSASDWLDRACQYERDGEQRKADMALAAATRADQAEHALDAKTASLARK